MYTRSKLILTGMTVLLFAAAASAALAGERIGEGAVSIPAATPANVAIDENRAAAIALGLAEGGTVVSTELRRTKDGGAIYSILIVDEDSRVKAAVDATNGRVMKFDRKNIETVKYPKKRQGWSAVDAEGDITSEKAREIALERTGGGTIVKVEKEYKKDGRILYEVEVVNAGRKIDIEMDARTGGIVEYKEKAPKYLRNPGKS